MTTSRGVRVALAAGLLAIVSSSPAQPPRSVEVRPNAASYTTSSQREGVVVVRGGSFNDASTDPRYVTSVLGPFTRSGALVPSTFGIADESDGSGGAFQMPSMAGGFIFSRMGLQPSAIERQQAHAEARRQLDALSSRFADVTRDNMTLIDPQLLGRLEQLFEPDAERVPTVSQRTEAGNMLARSIEIGQRFRSWLIGELTRAQTLVRELAETDLLLRVSYSRPPSPPEAAPEVENAYQQPEAGWLRFFISRYAVGGAEGTDVIVFAFQEPVAGTLMDVTIIVNVSADLSVVKVDWTEPPGPTSDDPAPRSECLNPGQMIRLEGETAGGNDLAHDAGGVKDYSTDPDVCAMVNEVRGVVAAVTQITIPECTGSTGGGDVGANP